MDARDDVRVGRSGGRGRGDVDRCRAGTGWGGRDAGWGQRESRGGCGFKAQLVCQSQQWRFAPG
ncbi:MAG: hypothetical protein ACRDXB_01695, partial [Actinomycetes bacterium]